jgi:hypothetical protein
VCWLRGLLDAVAIFPDHLEVTVLGVPRLNVTLQEAGLKPAEGQFVWCRRAEHPRMPVLRQLATGAVAHSIVLKRLSTICPRSNLEGATETFGSVGGAMLRGGAGRACGWRSMSARRST